MSSERDRRTSTGTSTGMQGEQQFKSFQREHEHDDDAVDPDENENEGQSSPHGDRAIDHRSHDSSIPPRSAPPAAVSHLTTPKIIQGSGMRPSPKRRVAPSFPSSPRGVSSNNTNFEDLAVAGAGVGFRRPPFSSRPLSANYSSFFSSSSYAPSLRSAEFGGTLRTPTILRVPPSPSPIDRDGYHQHQLVSPAQYSISYSYSPSSQQPGFRRRSLNEQEIGVVVSSSSSSSRGGQPADPYSRTGGPGQPQPQPPRNQQYTCRPSNALPRQIQHPYAPSVRSANTKSSDRTPSPYTRRGSAGGIPRDYILKSLRNRAPNFWNQTTMSDITILVPHLHGDAPTTSSPTNSITLAISSSASSRVAHLTGLPTGVPTSAVGNKSQAIEVEVKVKVEGADRKGGETIDNKTPTTAQDFAARRGAQTPTRTMSPADQPSKIEKYHLHRDYLVVQSGLIRQLIANANANATATATGTTTATGTAATIIDRRSSTGSDAPITSMIGGARIMKTPLGVPPTIWLPLPDPRSFGVLAHWLYHGDPLVVEHALGRGEITWQGIVKNVEYLGMDNEIKRVIRSWWRRWVKVAGGRVPPAAAAAASKARKEGIEIILDRSESGSVTSSQGMDVDLSDDQQGHREVITISRGEGDGVHSPSNLAEATSHVASLLKGL